VSFAEDKPDREEWGKVLRTELPTNSASSPADPAADHAGKPL
jgi:hypothetical protein